MLPRIFTFFVLWVAFIHPTTAQTPNAAPSSDNRKGYVYDKEKAAILQLSTNRGYELAFLWGRLRTYERTTFFKMAVTELHHPREVKQGAPPQARFRSFVYGKQNSLIAVRTSWGAKKYFSEKARHRGVAVGMSYSYGATLGLLKPYYLSLSFFEPDRPLNYVVRPTRYSEENADTFLDLNRILGAAPYWRGFSQIRPVPGGHASIALHFDWGAFESSMKALEIGAHLDVFTQAVPMMVAASNSPLFLNFFINVQLGKRK
jgi:hypothetical protein